MEVETMEPNDNPFEDGGCKTLFLTFDEVIKKLRKVLDKKTHKWDEKGNAVYFDTGYIYLSQDRDAQKRYFVIIYGEKLISEVLK